MHGLCEAFALACALTLTLGGCSAEESPDEQRLSYTVAPSAEPPPDDAGTDTSVETARRTCLASDGPRLAVPIPSAWKVDTSSIDECVWSTDDASITLTYGDMPKDNAAAWKSVLRQHREAELEDAIPGYAVTRYAANEGGGPLWHYRHIESGVEGSTYFDSLNLFRDGWKITYESESLDYNRYLADRLVKHAETS